MYRRTPPARGSATPTGGRRVSRVLEAQQAAIEALTQRVATLQAGSPATFSPPTASRAPVAAAPDKCKLDMSMSAFRSWRRSVECWLHLNKWTGVEAVMHLRLWCEAELQSALDARLSPQDLMALTPKTLLDDIQELVTSSSSQAVLWDVFFSSHQSAEESIKDYFNKCLQKAIDCRFKCPSCSSDLAEYILVRKIMVGLHSPLLKRELYQSTCESVTLDELKARCLAFEAASRDSMGGKPNVFGASVELSDEEETQPEDAVTATTGGRERHPRKEKCGNCGRTHIQGRQACPAKDIVCFKCELKGHMARCCAKGRAKKKGLEGKSSLGTVRVSSTGPSNLPKVDVEIRVPGNRKWGKSSAIADTGAEVCVAGPQHLRLLGLQKTQLQRANVKLVDIVGAPVPVWGMALCELKLNNVKCKNLVYFAKSSSCIFLSLNACKTLCLVPKGFPFDMVQVANCVAGSDGSMGAGVSKGGDVIGVLHDYDVSNVRGTCSDSGASSCSVNRTVGSEGLVCSQVGTPRLVDQGDDVSKVGGVSHCQKTTRSGTQSVDPPFQLTESNVDRLQEWFLQQFSATVFNISQCPLPMMTGPPHHIHLIPEAKPVAYHAPLPIPKHWEREVKKQLDDDVNQGILRKVAAGESTEWCSRMVVTSKKNGQPRRTVDFQPLNSVCLRETHHTAAPFDMVSNVPPHTYKSVLDAYSGFHQVELDEESQKLTTFITPWGRYQYLRTPMGHCSAPDAYTKRFDDIIVSIPRKYKCIDDTLLYDNSVEGAFWHMLDFLQVCEAQGITLNPSKFKFCKREVEFVGFQLGWDIYQPTDSRLSAIRDFTLPKEPSITDIRSWHGLVNQLAPFMATAPVMAPFRDLLKKPVNRKVYWDERLQKEFEEAKKTICKLAKEGLKYYDKSRPTVAVTDWSRQGIGFIVMQQYCNCVSIESPFCCKGGWRLVLCGSRHLAPAESAYAAVEGEALAVVWCLKKARLFLLGCPNLTIVTDHRPLVKLFGNRNLKDIDNPRLFRLKEKTLQFHFNVKYLPGKKNCAADTLSRYPSLQSEPECDDIELSDDVTVAVMTSLVSALEADDLVVIDQDDVIDAARDDPVYQLLRDRVREGNWPSSKNQEIECLKCFYGVRERLSLSGELVIYTFDQGCARLVIPDELRSRVAINLHSGHQGLDSMLRRARQSVYWPGLAGDLEYQRAKCENCELHSPSQHQEWLTMSPPPEYPFQKVVADLFQVNGRTYLAYADRLTGWVEVAHLHMGTTSGQIIKKFRQYFVRWGSPEELSTDGGTNLASDEMREFLKKWGVTARVSSALYPQSNGRAEAGVKVAKRTIGDHTGVGGTLDTDAVAKALLQYHNTPLHGEEFSPAQLATGRYLRDSVPVSRQYYKVNCHWKKALRLRELEMAKKNESVALKDHGRNKSLRPLDVGMKVRVQDPTSKVWDRTGVILEVCDHRKYSIRLDGSGRVSIRNRRHLKQSLAGRTNDVDNGVAEMPQPESYRPQGERKQRCTRRPRWHEDYDMG